MQLQSIFDLDRAHKQLVVLGYFLGILHSQNNDHDYCNTLRVKIIPLIRLIAPEKVNKWVKEKKDYILKCERLKRQVIKEVEAILGVLKQRLEEESLLDAPGIEAAWLALELILDPKTENKKVCVMPEQYIVAFQYLTNFYYAIIRLGRKDLIEDYIGECAYDFKKYWDSDIHFNKSSFVPSYFELCEINEVFLRSAFRAWDKLYSIEWGWSANRRDYFRKKKLHYNNDKAAARSSKLLNANGYWYEVKVVKERRKSTLFTREYLTDYVNLVTREIDAKLIEFIVDDVVCLPEAIRLSLENYKELRLIVQWTEGLCEVKDLHTFHYSDPDDYSNVRYDFLKNMIQKPGVIIKIDPVSGAKATKYLRDIGLYGVLDTLFVVSKRGDKAGLISDQIDLEGQPETVICDLRNHLQTVETFEWRKKITAGPLE